TQQFDSAIEIDYSSGTRQHYLVAHYVKDQSAPGGYRATQDFHHFNLIATDGSYGGGRQTILISNIAGDGEGTPLNALLVGGDDDVLEYHGTGHAIIIGGGSSISLWADPGASPDAAPNAAGAPSAGAGSILYGGFLLSGVPYNPPFTVPGWEQTLINQVPSDDG